MKVLITGGLGFLGSNLAHRLLEKGYTVTVLDLPETNTKNVGDIMDEITILRGDIRDSSVVNGAVKGQDAVLHLAGQVSHLVSMKDPWLDFQTNVKGTLNVLEAARKHTPDLLVFASSRSVYGIQMKKPDDPPIKEDVVLRPIDVYGVSKVACEKLCLTYHHHYAVPVTCFRQANLVGERQQLHTPVYQMVSWVLRQYMLRLPLEFMGTGEQTRDFLYVGDLCEAYEMAILNPEKVAGQVFNTGGATYCTWNEVFKTAEKVTGNRINIIYKDYTDLRRKLENPYSRLSSEKIEKALGWKPRTTLEEAYKRMVSYYLPDRIKQYIEVFEKWRS